jgi:hypothetical protein
MIDGSFGGAIVQRVWVPSFFCAAFCVLPCSLPAVTRADTVALWLFDEQVGIYPSCVLGDAATNDCPLVLGPGGQIVEGKYGNALEASEHPKLKLAQANRDTGFERRPEMLNIDTGATGFAQVGILDENGEPIEGVGVDDCVYINGDFIETEVEWLKKGTDLSALAGKPVKVMIRSRGTKLYSLQFVDR